MRHDILNARLSYEKSMSEVRMVSYLTKRAVVRSGRRVPGGKKLGLTGSCMYLTNFKAKKTMCSHTLTDLRENDF